PMCGARLNPKASPARAAPAPPPGPPPPRPPPPPAAPLAGVLPPMPAGGVGLGDILADSGYSHRQPGTWAEPLRAAGASLVQDLHPNDRGPRGTHHGPIIANGCLYCPPPPKPLLGRV